jgi:hypothetical protein
VKHDYDSLGLLGKRSFLPVRPYFGQTFKYNIRDWLENTSAGNLAGSPQFTERIAYETASPLSLSSSAPNLAFQYNGNISALEYTYPSSNQNMPLLLSYTYDKVNRLKSVGAASDDVTLQPSAFQEVFEYDQVGRISKKLEGALYLTEAPTYSYYSQSNKLEKLIPPESGSLTRSENNNFVYDLDGNMILDKSKKMAISYDWRDMPVSFKFYDNNPAVASNSSLDFTGCNLVSEVRMVYDASGNRVLKTTLTPKQQ